MSSTRPLRVKRFTRCLIVTFSALRSTERPLTLFPFSAVNPGREVAGRLAPVRGWPCNPSSATSVCVALVHLAGFRRRLRSSAGTAGRQQSSY
ncbi:exported hypothetical protein [Curtobacterium sp. 8I-2]|nr:exported hypothetical protein [Curtobacterium sp. 8I-2]